MRNLKTSLAALFISAIVIILTILIVSTGCVNTQCESHRKPEAPKNHATTLDSVIAEDGERGKLLSSDTVWIFDCNKEQLEELGGYRLIEIYENDTLMYEFPCRKINHGKEGQSEFGEYQPTDEHRMWIGENGDTIWE